MIIISEASLRIFLSKTKPELGQSMEGPSQRVIGTMSVYLVYITKNLPVYCNDLGVTGQGQIYFKSVAICLTTRNANSSSIFLPRVVIFGTCTFVLYSFEWPLKTGFTVYYNVGVYSPIWSLQIYLKSVVWFTTQLFCFD